MADGEQRASARPPSSKKQARAGSRRAKRPKRRRSKRASRRRLTGLLFGVGTLVSLLGLLWGGLWLWGREPQSRGTGFVRLRLDTTERQHVAEGLERAGLLQSRQAFVWFLRWVTPRANLRPGEHLLPRDATPSQLVRLLARSSGRAHRSVLIPEGFDLFQVAERLERQGICPEREFLEAALDEQLAAQLAGQPSLEGYLFPATYDLHQNSLPKTVLTRMSKEANKRWRALFQAQARQLDALRQRAELGPHGIITLASIVEKEAADAAEFGAVASVFLNRLSDPTFRPRGMLQSDPTAGYGCKLHPKLPSCSRYQGRILPEMLRDPRNPYNTYLHSGLPPGPIGNPSQRAVEAVLGAPVTKYLFFVAGPSGRHIFSSSLADHKRAIQSTRPRRQ